MGGEASRFSDDLVSLQAKVKDLFNTSYTPIQDQARALDADALNLIPMTEKLHPELVSHVRAIRAGLSQLMNFKSSGEGFRPTSAPDIVKTSLELMNQQSIAEKVVLNRQIPPGDDRDAVVIGSILIDLDRLIAQTTQRHTTARLSQMGVLQSFGNDLPNSEQDWRLAAMRKSWNEATTTTRKLCEDWDAMAKRLSAESAAFR
jgi:hypothetical protein